MDKFEWVEVLCLLPEAQRLRAEVGLVRGVHPAWVVASAVESRIVDVSIWGGCPRETSFHEVCEAVRSAKKGDFTALLHIMYDLDMGG